MSKTAVVTARIDPNLKRSTEEIFQELGLTTSQAINLFYKQVELQQGLPFRVALPNETTLQALADARQRRNLDTFDTTEALFDDLDI